MTVNSRISHLNLKKKRLSYLREIQNEFKKVTWTTKQELIAYTKMVLGATLLFGLLIYIADLVIRNILLLINVIFNWIS